MPFPGNRQSIGARVKIVEQRAAEKKENSEIAIRMFALGCRHSNPRTGTRCCEATEPGESRCVRHKGSSPAVIHGLGSTLALLHG